MFFVCKRCYKLCLINPKYWCCKVMVVTMLVTGLTHSLLLHADKRKQLLNSDGFLDATTFKYYCTSSWKVNQSLWSILVSGNFKLCSTNDIETLVTKTVKNYVRPYIPQMCFLLVFFHQLFHLWISPSFQLPNPTCHQPFQPFWTN